jgi:hypothetical protein
MYQLGYDWKYAHEWPTLTTEGFQAKLLATKRGDPLTSRAPLNIVSKPYTCSCEARKSVLVNVLVFINDIFGYHIGDLHFTQLKMRKSTSLGSSGDILCLHELWGVLGMIWFKFIMVCMKFDYGMDDHCNIQHLT